MKASLDIIIVNWNSGNMLAKCLESINGCELAEFELSRVVVVDNASTDASNDDLSEIALPLFLIKNEVNRGFAAACNQGSRGSRADYLLFLNPDTRLKSGSLLAPLRFMEENRNRGIGICGIKLVDENGRTSRTCARFPTLASLLVYATGLNRVVPSHFKRYQMDDWPHSESQEVDHVIGAFYFVRRPLFTLLDGFDENYFVYLEDIDFSLRARQAGYSSFFLETETAFHKGGGSSEQIKAQRLFYHLYSRIVYVKKHFCKGSAIVAISVTLMIEPVVRALNAIFTLSIDRLQEVLGAYYLLFGKVLSDRFRRISTS